MTKFNVGDKVIFNKENAHVAKQFDYKINKPYEVQKVFPFHCTVQIINEKGSSHSFDEERFELVETKPTKNQRITALENEVAELRPLKQEVAELKLIVHELRDGPKTMRDVMNEVLSEPSTTTTVEDIIEFEGQQYRKVDREACEGDVVMFTVNNNHYQNNKSYKVIRNVTFTDDNGKVIFVYNNLKRTPENVAVYELIQSKPLTPNQQRAAIIEKAKKFVEEKGKGFDFSINDNKRTTAFNIRTEKAGFAKCNPSDVFNEHIGKAIALGRALGLDVSEFEQAVQPNEFSVGQLIQFHFFKESHEIIEISNGRAYFITDGQREFHYTYRAGEEGYSILNDTNAKYEVIQ